MSDSDTLDHESEREETESFDTEPHPNLYRHGRRYSLTHLEQHPWPIDEIEKDRLEEQHVLLRELFEDRLYLAPIESPRSVLDIRTGTGCWAMECAERYPSSTVRGIDLVNMQDEWVPPNCEFWVDNLCQPGWHTQYTDIDFVHINQIQGDRQLLSLLLEGSHSCCAPGGWVEIRDMRVKLDNPGEDSPFHNYIREMATAQARDGRQMDLPLHFGAELTRHGFTNITERNYDIPLCTEGRDKLMERIIQNWTTGLEGYSFTLLEKHLGKNFTETVLMCASARRALKGKIEGYLQMSKSRVWTETGLDEL
ncbi:hypothetical protein ASPTUDRAFT_57211 [Aspergillus tubingensis CBS 134.48]|uniref:Methyltransferase domain-containing protein n=1 Tax=Aspergillus tubingensis (strain CBS 134.48) TaxID=767770 RepID=A0A1L9N1V0_ASPTC|nr:hypothetical protein ASPTUDRAFT_57211 [Aspergillus tubingensis CBS 134.48]